MMTQFANSLRLAAFLGLFSLLLFGCSSCIDRETVDERHKSGEAEDPDVSCEFHLKDIFNKGIEEVLRNDKLDVVILDAPSNYRVDDYFPGVFLFVNNKHFYGVSSKGVVVYKFLNDFKVEEEVGTPHIHKSIVDRAKLEAYKKLAEQNPGLIGKHLREVTNKMGRPIHCSGYECVNDGRLILVPCDRPFDPTSSIFKAPRKDKEIDDPEERLKRKKEIEKAEAWASAYGDMWGAAIAKFVFEGGLAIYTDSNGTILIADQEKYYEGHGWR